MLLYYYYTNSNYRRKLSDEIEYIYKLYNEYYKVRLSDQKSLKYTIGNLLFNVSRLVMNNQDTLVFTKERKFFDEGIKVNGKQCKIKLSYTFFNKLINILKDECMIDVKLGGDFIYHEHIDSNGEIKKIATGERTVSKMVVNEKLLILLRDKTIKYSMENIMILRDEDKNDLQYEPTQLQLQQIHFLKGYNDHLSDFKFLDKDGKLIAEPFLRRIFNTSFELGGRYYTQMGVIQTMSPEDRLKIIVDGRKCCEVDAVALHPSILATRAGIHVDYDPYDFEVPAEIDYEAIEKYKVKYGKNQYDPVRNLNKIAVLLAFNNKTRGAALQSISRKLRDDTNLPEKDRMYFGINFLDINQLYANMANRNLAISESFGSNAGAFLQWLDSTWMERVLGYMIQLNIPAIPVHDSIVCPEDCVDNVVKAMTLAYEQSFGNSYNLKLKIKKY